MIGLDTHDPVLRHIPFAPGMVMTVEPGLYLEEEGIGIRIEDNVLITEDGAVNLSVDIIKSVEDIEQLMKES
jgi:Xaa-Pro aminopeptidase